MMRLCPFMRTMDGGQVALPDSQKKLFLFLCFENEKNQNAWMGKLAEFLQFNKHLFLNQASIPLKTLLTFKFIFVYRNPPK